MVNGIKYEYPKKLGMMILEEALKIEKFMQMGLYLDDYVYDATTREIHRNSAKMHQKKNKMLKYYN
jgi:predicted metal-dependent RNase